MKHELKVPSVGESIQEVQIGQWLKGEGQWANKDESLVEIESDKATVDVPRRRPASWCRSCTAKATWCRWAP